MNRERSGQRKSPLSVRRYEEEGSESSGSESQRIRRGRSSPRRSRSPVRGRKSPARRASKSRSPVRRRSSRSPSRRSRSPLRSRSPSRAVRGQSPQRQQVAYGRFHGERHHHHGGEGRYYRGGYGPNYGYPGYAGAILPAVGLGVLGGAALGGAFY